VTRAEAGRTLSRPYPSAVEIGGCFRRGWGGGGEGAPRPLRQSGCGIAVAVSCRQAPRLARSSLSGLLALRGPAARAALVPLSPPARAQLSAQAPLPPGAHSWGSRASTPALIAPGAVWSTSDGDGDLDAWSERPWDAALLREHGSSASPASSRDDREWESVQRHQRRLLEPARGCRSRGDGDLDAVVGELLDVAATSANTGSSASLCSSRHRE